MNIAAILTHSTGGAGIAASRLVNQFEDKLKEVYTKNGANISNESIVYAGKPMPFTDKFRQKFFQKKLNIPVGGVTKTSPQSEIYVGRLSSDIINLHWVGRYLDWHTFFRDNSDKPIFWTIHDMNPFIGMYHYDGDMQYDDHKYDAIEEEVRLHKLALINKFSPKLHICSPSKWLMEESKKSEAFGRYPHYHIPNSIPLDVYAPVKTELAKGHFSLENKPTLMFSAEVLTTKRKGFHLLEEILPEILKTGIQVIAVGHSEKKTEGIKYLGSIKDEHEMTIAYNACDAYILPSLQDNLPNTMLESMACGKPVISFDHYGMGENITDAMNGFLSKEISAKGLMKTVLRWFEFFHSKENSESFYARIRTEVENKFAPEIQRDAYLKIFEEALQRKQ